MPAPYSILNMSRPYELFTYSNTVTEGLFGTAVLIVFFLVCTIIMKNYENKRAITASAFMTSLLAGLFYLLGIVTPIVVFTAIIITAVGVVWLHIDKQP